jgi:hypothetical protein
MRCASTVIGAELLIDELLGYSIVRCIILSNAEAYTYAHAMYHKEWDINVPKSQRKKYIAGHWWM